MSDEGTAHRTSQRKRGRKPLPTPDESELEAMSDTERALVERRLRNRSKAVLSRERRAVKVGALQKKVSSLQATNKRLQRELDQATAQLRALHAPSSAELQGGNQAAAGLAEMPGAQALPNNSKADHLARSQSAGVLLPGQATFGGLEYLDPGFTAEEEVVEGHGEGENPPSAQSSGHGQQPPTPHAGNHRIQQQQLEQQQKEQPSSHLMPDSIPLHHIPKQVHIYGGDNNINAEEEELFPLVFSPFASEIPAADSLWNHHNQEHNGSMQETFAEFRPGLGKGISFNGINGVVNQSHSEEGGSGRDQMDMYRMMSAPAAMNFDIHQGVLG